MQPAGNEGLLRSRSGMGTVAVVLTRCCGLDITDSRNRLPGAPGRPIERARCCEAAAGSGLLGPPFRSLMHRGLAGLKNMDLVRAKPP